MNLLRFKQNANDTVYNVIIFIYNWLKGFHINYQVSQYVD